MRQLGKRSNEISLLGVFEVRDEGRPSVGAMNGVVFRRVQRTVDAPGRGLRSAHRFVQVLRPRAPPSFPPASHATVAFGRLAAGGRLLFLQPTVTNAEEEKDLRLACSSRCVPCGARLARPKSDDLSHGGGLVSHS